MKVFDEAINHGVSMKYHLVLCLFLALIVLPAGCYNFAGVHTDTDVKEFNNVDVGHVASYPIRDYDDRERAKQLPEIADFIEKKFLKEVKERIAKEHIRLPPIQLNQVVSGSYIPKPIDNEYELSEESRKQLEDEACAGLTALTVMLLERIKLFEKVETTSEDNGEKPMVATIYISAFEDGQSSIFGHYMVPAFIVGVSTLGIITPASYYKIFTLKCDFAKDDNNPIVVQASGGGYSHQGTIWMDEISTTHKMYNIALGRAYEELFMRIIDNKDKFMEQAVCPSSSGILKNK